MVTLKTPPIMQGNVQAQLTAQRDYLIYMQRELERALNNLDSSNFSGSTEVQHILSGATSETTKNEISQQTATLKQLIIKTADIVRSEMDEITTQLSSNFVAESEFGTYKEEVTNEITASANGLRMELDFKDEIKNLSDDSEMFKSYMASTSGYIQIGIVDNTGTVPKFGVAVGQNMPEERIEYEGRQYVDLTSNINYMSIFTADGLSFYQNNVRVAYLDDDKLYITSAHIIGKLEMGGTEGFADWELSTTNGLTLKWVGA